ncbi:beta strand repeat-containing protein, partial [Sulfitobacter donghicola]
GDGTDEVLYDRDGGTSGVSVNLETGVARDTFGNTDTLTNIEAVYGSDQNDVLTGRRGEGDLLVGGGGNDVINGAGGDDTLAGGAGADTIDGGSGLDQVAYFREDGTSGVNVNLTTGVAIDTFGNSDRILNVEYVLGTDANDRIIGSNRIKDDRLFGRGGDDYLDGLDGDNLIFTGAGNDTVVVGTTLEDARDTVVIDGRGIKTITGTGSEGTRYAHHIVFRTDSAVTVNLAKGIATSDGMRTDFSAALHFLELNGSAYADSLTGGNLRHQELEWYVGFQGNDTINGATGTGDTVVYNAEVTIGQLNYQTGQIERGIQGVVVNLSTGVAIDSFGDRDTLINIDQVHGTIFADSIIGGADDNDFWSLAGADTIDGGAGIDAVHYGEDLLTEGGTLGITADLVAGRITDGFGDVDVVRNIEDVYGTDLADLISGNGGDNRLVGEAGSDTLNGAGGNDILLGRDDNDVLNGGVGDDEIWGGAGADTIDGGAGQDLARYLEATGAVNANLTTGVVRDGYGFTDTLTNIEDLHASGNNDSVVGSNGANRLFGFGGRDTLLGQDGDDVLLGGEGNDSLLGGNGDDEIWGEAGADTIDGGTGSDLVRYRDEARGVSVDLSIGVATDGGQARDTLINIENVHGSEHVDQITGNSAANRLFGFAGNDQISGNAGDDIILGGAGNDSLTGGDGNDQLWGEVGTDTINGGAGAGDVVRYLNSTSDVTVDLVKGTAWDGLGYFDTLRDIEHAHGSDFNDLLRGDGQANQLFGFDGNDTMLGGEGDGDVSSGGAGGDTYIYRTGDGRDSINDLGTTTGGSDTVIVEGYLAENMAVTLGGADNLVMDFGNAHGARDVLTLANSYSGTHAGAIEQVQFADGSTFTMEQLHARVFENRRDAIDVGDLVEVGDVATSGADVLSVTSTTTTLDGLGGNDIISGRETDDVLRGGSGSDTLKGNAGDDTLDGGTSNDVLFGGEGADHFVLSTGMGNDTVRDFEFGTDGLDTSGLSSSQISALVTTQVTGGQKVTLADGGSITLLGDTSGDVDRLVIIGAETQDATLTVTLEGATTLLGETPSAVSYEWLRDGNVVSGATSQSYVLTQADTEAQISARVTYNGNTLTSTPTQAITNLNDAPVGALVVNGTPTEDQTLTASTADISDVDGLGSFSYQWLRSGERIESAVASSYTLTQRDVGNFVTVEVTYTDGSGQAEKLISSQTGPIANVNDPVGGTLIVGGGLREGEQLSVDPAITDEDGLGPISYQWFRDNVAVSGQTGTTYTLGADDVETELFVRGTYTDGFGTVEQVSSTPVEVQAAPVIEEPVDVGF